MAKGFGEFYKLQGIVIFALSPFEQRAYAGAIKYGLPNILRRTRESIFYFAPPLLTAYMVFDLVEKKHEELSRKNPKNFENDV